MKDTCDRCYGELPLVPGITEADTRNSTSRFYVSHVCEGPDSTFHQSITFITGCLAAATRAARVWVDDSLWDL